MGQVSRLVHRPEGTAGLAAGETRRESCPTLRIDSLRARVGHASASPPLQVYMGDKLKHNAAYIAVKRGMPVAGRRFLLDKSREIGYVLMGEHTQSADSA